jgi:hypothetical protein
VRGANLGQQGEAARAGELEVGEHQIEARAAQNRVRFARVARCVGFEPHALEQDLEGAPHAAVVVDDEHALQHGVG